MHLHINKIHLNVLILIFTQTNKQRIKTLNNRFSENRFSEREKSINVRTVFTKQDKNLKTNKKSLQFFFYLRFGIFFDKIICGLQKKCVIRHAGDRSPTVGCVMRVTEASTLQKLKVVFTTPPSRRHRLGNG